VGRDDHGASNDRLLARGLFLQSGAMPTMEDAQAQQAKAEAQEEQRRTMLVAILSPEARSRREFECGDAFGRETGMWALRSAGFAPPQGRQGAATAF